MATATPRGAAFFDLDRTLLAGASGEVFSHAMKAAGLVSRSIPGESLLYKVFNTVGFPQWLDSSGKNQLVGKNRLAYIASLPNPVEILSGFVSNLYSKQKYALMGMQARTDVLASLADEVASGRVEVVIGQTFPLAAFRDAYAQTAAGRFVGKVVFTMGESS